MITLFLYVIAFLSLGLWLGLKIIQRNLFPREFLYIVSVGASLLAFYFLFYVYAVEPWLGFMALMGLFGLSAITLGSIILSCRRSPEQTQLICRYFAMPLGITGVIFIIFSSLLYGCRLPMQPGSDSRRVVNESFCAIEQLPLDNGLPLMFATFSMNNEPRSQVIDWTIADRPPLQIGSSLPIVELLRNAPPLQVGNIYNVFSIFLQLSWVGAIWGLLQWLKVRRVFQVLLLTGFATTGFFYLNSIFVWPKLLGAALVIGAIAPFMGSSLNKKQLAYLPVAAGLVSLGLMAHTSLMFTVIPFALVLLYKLIKARRLIQYKHLVVAVGVTLLILLPWQVFKNTITTSDRLVKYHFANVTSYDDKRDTLQAIVDEYKKLPFEQWVHNKIANVKSLLIVDIDKPNWKTLTFFSTFFALEAFSLGLLPLIYNIVRRRLDGFDKETLLLIGGTLLVWILLMFNPGSTVVHQGSYATMVLLFILLGKQFLKLPPVWLSSLVGAQVIVFYLTWVSNIVTLFK